MMGVRAALGMTGTELDTFAEAFEHEERIATQRPVAIGDAVARAILVGQRKPSAGEGEADIERGVVGEHGGAHVGAHVAEPRGAQLCQRSGVQLW